MVVVTQSPFICQKTHEYKEIQSERDMSLIIIIVINMKTKLDLIKKTTLKHSQPSNSYSFLNSLCAQRNRDDKRDHATQSTTPLSH